ncbi:MAG: hypothetical protein ABSE73_09700 [Planctomycetota bacterium]
MASSATASVNVASVPSVLRCAGVSETPGQRPGRSSGKLIFRAAAKAAEFSDRLCAHYRETRRIAVEIPCDIRLVLSDGALFDAGSAVVRNISPSGALVSAIRLEKGCYPARPFKVVLILKNDEYRGIGIEATPMRITAEAAGLGVRFDEVFVNVEP